MRIILLILALSLPLAAQRVSGSNVVGSVANAQKLGGKPACSASVTTNCHKALDASGNLAMVATLPSDGIVTTTGTSLTLANATHNGKILKFTAGTDVTLTLNAGIGTAGFSVLIVQRGAGAVIPTAGAGVTIRQRQSYTKTAGQYAVASLVCDVADDCILSGDLQ